MDEKLMEMYQTIMNKLAHHDESMDKLWEHYSKLKGGSYMHHHEPEITNVFKPHSGGGYDGLMGGLGGGGLLGGLLIGALLGRGGNGLFGGNGAGDGMVVNEMTQISALSKLGDIQGAIPLAAAQTQNAILAQSNDICQGLNQLGNTVAANGTSNLLATKDLATQVANGNATILQAISQAEIQTLRDQIALLNTNHRALGTEVNVTQSVSQMQQQAQQQQQLNNIFGILSGLPAFIQRGQNELINIGSGTMSGNSAANTNTAIR
ncbi:hypothetical protein UFOVP139_34 [uncultured Caudovirales phage]|uniref:Uncharacterized protein n=1 Tax=uncultured Caudovirales phage TaxID=2100421 RepID=A0A6J5LKT8_9CAUD|nr:hypothetical protein UFOVP139_34 [uncultured Caudovirales phage]